MKPFGLLSLLWALLLTRSFCQGYRDCKEIYDSDKKTSGLYVINPDNLGNFLVFCDMDTDGGGWTAIQRRLDGTIGFYRDWEEYKEGFGNKMAEHWLGLEKIRRMTSQKNYQLRVDLVDIDGLTKYAKYSYFAVNSEALKYKLNLGLYSGTAGDSLSYHDNKMFTTKDKDNDSHSTGNCALSHKGGWWYVKCHTSNLNGQYLDPGTISTNGITWLKWKGSYYSAKRAEMKIRPV